MSSLKRLFCQHEFEFLRNVHGDEIIEWGYKRSIWVCRKCGRYKAKPELHEIASNEEKGGTA